jgi:Transcriptional regulator, AbiEi antitoxin/Protein of unknown function (DUF559)
VVALADRQFGVVSTAQLLHCGLSAAGIARWVERGWLYRVARGVYAVGHRNLTCEGRLSAVLLQGGPGAALSHLTAAWWWGLLRYHSGRTHVSAPGRSSSTSAVHVHHPTKLERRWHRGLPVVSVTQTLIQIAPICSFVALRRALAEADHRGSLDLAALNRELARRPRGSSRLRLALDRHMPQLAETLSPLEDRFLLLCEHYGIPLPEPNSDVNGYLVDALWPAAGLAVELDGREVHGTPAAVARDRGRDLTLRRAGLEVIRYSSEQVDYHSDLIAADLNTALARGLAARRDTRARNEVRPRRSPRS